MIPLLRDPIFSRRLAHKGTARTVAQKTVLTVRISDSIYSVLATFNDAGIFLEEKLAQSSAVPAKQLISRPD